MFLAATGKLKHKRTRNTIAAEPTPRSSCPSSAEAAASEHAAGAAASDPPDAIHNTHAHGGENRSSNPASKLASTAARAGSTPAALRNDLEAMPVEINPEHAGDSSLQSPHPRLLMSAVYRQEDDSDHDDLYASSKTHAEKATSPERRKLGSARPQSAGGGGAGRRSRSPVQDVGTIDRHATQDDPTVNRQPPPDVPLHVGPEVVAPPADHVAKACVGRAEQSTAMRRRPMSAGAAATGKQQWGVELQSRTRVVNRGFGDRGRCHGGRNGGRGRGGGRDGRDARGKFGGMARPTPNAAAQVGESTARSVDGSFAESVIKSARPFAAYDYIAAATTTKRRPKSAGAATTAPAAPAFEPESREAHAFAAVDTRFMPVGVIDKAFKGRRLAAVQARDPRAAAAVRAARAEMLLRRRRLGRAGVRGASAAAAAASAATPMPAAASDRGRPGEARVGGRGGGEALSFRGEAGSGRRSGPSWARLGRGKGKGRRGGEVDCCGTGGMRKDGRGHRGSREPGPAVGVVDAAGDSGHGGSGNEWASARNFTPNELDKRKRPPCSSRPSSANGSSVAALNTARASTATAYSCSSSTSRSRSYEMAAEERRARLLAELETLRRRMADAEGLLREVDSSLQQQSKPKKRPATSRAAARISGRERHDTRASLVATTGATSAKSSAGYGAFNLGERRTSPVVVTHPANAYPDEM
eukprot:g16694.t1